MERKHADYINKGMRRDLSISKTGTEYAYENFNIRITPNDYDTLLSVTNERSEKFIETIKGVVLGHAVLNDYLVIFTKDKDKDYIMCKDFSKGSSEAFTVLVEGNFNFSIDHPIETIPLYEAEDIQKVYWTDGYNQPRVINIKGNNTISGSSSIITDFDFVTTYKSGLEVSVEKQKTGSGLFTPGVVQYFFTYYNSHMQETNIVQSTSLYYLSDVDKGNANDTTCNCSFKITLKNLDPSFDYVRIYALIRTSLNGTPVLNLVNELSLAGVDKTTELSVIDTGAYSVSLDPTILMYIGGRAVSAGTFTHKDNTLFLGDLHLKDELFDSEIESYIEEGAVQVEFVKDSTIPYYPDKTLYNYESQLSYSSAQIKIFKTNNLYRIGCRFYKNTGAATQIYFLKDLVSPYYPEINEDESTITRSSVVATFSDELRNYLVNNNYVSVQLFMAQPSETDKLVAAQGVLCPTMFQMNERVGNSPFAIASWCFRPENGVKAYQFYDPVAGSLDTVNDFKAVKWENSETGPTIDLSDISATDLQNNGITSGTEFQHITVSDSVYISNSATSDSSGQTVTNAYFIIRCWKGKGGQQIRMGGTIYFGKDRTMSGWSSEISFSTDQKSNWNTVINQTLNAFSNRGIQLPPDARDKLNLLANQTKKGTHYYLKNTWSSSPTPNKPNYSDSNEYIQQNLVNDYGGERGTRIARFGTHYYVDNSLVTMHTPEINDDTVGSFEGYKLRIIGVVPITSVLSDYNMEVTPDNLGESNIVKLNFSSNESVDGVGTIPAYQTENNTFWVFPWHKSNSITMHKNDADGSYYSEIEKKIWSNLYYSYRTIFFSKSKTLKLDTPRLITSSNSTYSFNQGDTLGLYKSNYETVIPVDNNTRYPIFTTGGIYGGGNSDILMNSFSMDNTELYNSPIDCSYKSTAHLFLPIMPEKDEPHLTMIGLPYVDDNSGNHSEDQYLSNVSFGLPLWTTDTYAAGGDHLFAHSADTVPLTQADRDKWMYVGPNAGSNKISIGEYFSDSERQNIYYCWIRKDFFDWYGYDPGTTKPGIGFFYKDLDTYNQPYGKLKEIEVIKVPLFPESSGFPEEEGSYIISDDETRKTTIYWELANQSSWFPYKDKLDIKLQLYSVDSTGAETFRDEITWTFGTSKDEQKTVKWVLEDYFVPTGTKLKFVMRAIPKSEEGTASSGSAQAYNIAIPYYYEKNGVTLSEYGVGYRYNIGENKPNYPDSNGNSIVLSDYYYMEYLRPSSADLYIQVQDTKNNKHYIYNGSSTSLIDITDKIVSFEFKREEIPLDWINENEQKYINVKSEESVPYLLLGELYREANGSEYGGTSDYAKQNNVFIPIGNITSIDPSKALKASGTEGDAFFQRWDCLKTYPYSEDKQNNVVEMLSFMVETYTNIDGRYDNRRGLADNTATTPENSNLINQVYSQENNYITGQILGDEGERIDFPAQITWSKTKSPTEDVDTWTNITLASVLDMDGDKGSVNALRRFQNSIIAFQDKGIAEVLFNSRTQLATTQGVPIEIANSGKVDGKRYITDKAGCINKWSIVETRNGIYFIDDLNSTISVFNGNIQSLSDMKGFKNWISHHVSNEVWKPLKYSNFASFWDKTNDDIYFTKDGICLCYNELLNDFTSFYSYSDIAGMASIRSSFYILHSAESSSYGSSLWEVGKGDSYNTFHKKGSIKSDALTESSYIEYRVTPEPYTDKIFTNVDYRADFFDMEGLSLDSMIPGALTSDTFDNLEIKDEYQTRNIDLSKNKFKPSDVKSKFRIWRIQLPRDMKGIDNPYGLNRIRNPWMAYRLTHNPSLDEKDKYRRMVFHNFGVTYYQ